MPQDPSARTSRADLDIDPALVRFIDDEVLPRIALDASEFWENLARLLDVFVPRNRNLLQVREAMQAKIDAWHRERAGSPHDPEAYHRFLQELGYLVG